MIAYVCICIMMWSNHAFRLPSSFIIQLFSLSLMMSCILFLGVLDIEQLEAVEWHPDLSNRMLQYCKQWQRCRNAQHFLALRGSNPLVVVVAVFSSLFLNFNMLVRGGSRCATQRSSLPSPILSQQHTHLKFWAQGQLCLTFSAFLIQKLHFAKTPMVAQ